MALNRWICALVHWISFCNVLRWLSLTWLLAVPLAPIEPGQSQLQPAQPPERFDDRLKQLEVQQPKTLGLTPQDLEKLEADRVITPQERDLNGRDALVRPVDVPSVQRACQEGALSRKECSSGVVRQMRPGRRTPRVEVEGMPGQVDSVAGSSPKTSPLTVPVSALIGSDSSFSLQSVFSVTPRPLPKLGNGDRKLLFPVVGEAFTSSGFGWRLHPVVGTWLMHAGRDFAAPEGAPVVASLSGTVVSSGLAGGYGITVVLEHDSPKRRTLYGHLSEIYVKAGQTVQQGEVIGRVGSTGLSTGPHLHFELRRPQGDGWVAIDPQELDMAPLIDTMKAEGADPVSVLMAQLLRSLERPDDVRPTPPAG